MDVEIIMQSIATVFGLPESDPFMRYVETVTVVDGKEQHFQVTDLDTGETTELY